MGLVAAINTGRECLPSRSHAHIPRTPEVTHGGLLSLARRLAPHRDLAPWVVVVIVVTRAPDAPFLVVPVGIESAFFELLAVITAYLDLLADFCAVALVQFVAVEFDIDVGFRAVRHRKGD